MSDAKKTLRITQVKSSIGYKKDQLATLKALVLARSVVPSTRWTTSVRGIIFKVKHLVKVEEL